MTRCTTPVRALPAIINPARPALRRLVVTHVRQALQQTVAVGAISPYFAAVCAIGPRQICFMPRV